MRRLILFSPPLSLSPVSSAEINGTRNKKLFPCSLRLTRRSFSAVGGRSYTGILVISRNDISLTVTRKESLITAASRNHRERFSKSFQFSITLANATKDLQDGPELSSHFFLFKKKISKEFIKCL